MIALMVVGCVVWLLGIWMMLRTQHRNTGFVVAEAGAILYVVAIWA